jgi:23S rRNA pseudouridine2605 synthase
MKARPGKSHVSLERALSKLGVASRAQARPIIEAGRVAVGGRITKNPLAWVDLSRETLQLDGRPVAKAPRVYLAMNKPAGIVTTRSDERGRRTVYDLLPEGLPPVFPVGRLDRDTSGLLLFTNDTRWADALTDPNTKIPKTYRARVDRPATDADAAALARPIVLDDGTRLRAARVRRDPNDAARFEITIEEGKNRQIRRACETVGLTVVELERISIGPLTLGRLVPGATCRLDANQVSSLRPAKLTIRKPTIHP